MIPSTRRFVSGLKHSDPAPNVLVLQLALSEKVGSQQDRLIAAIEEEEGEFVQDETRPGCPDLASVACALTMPA